MEKKFSPTIGFAVTPPVHKIKPNNFAGGGPAASYFSCFAKKSSQKKATPAHRPSGSLRCSPDRAAAQLATTLVTII
jgi:hypothetical protein